jgi:hypothetical protein
MSDFYIAIILVLVAVVLVVWFLRYKAGSSKKRMMQMLQCAGFQRAQTGWPDLKSNPGKKAC